MCGSHEKDFENVHINGGAYVGRDVDTWGGDFIGRDKHIYGDEVHDDKVETKNVYQGPAYPRLNYRRDIDGLIRFYTETYVGRQDAWNKIVGFAAQPDPGYLLVEAPAGYGKSALIAHVIHCHENKQWDGIVYPLHDYMLIENLTF